MLQAVVRDHQVEGPSREGQPRRIGLDTVRRMQSFAVQVDSHDGERTSIRLEAAPAAAQIQNHRSSRETAQKLIHDE